jgi:hypothetical protein
MKPFISTVVILFSFMNMVFPQAQPDSLIRFSDLRFQSDFEKNAFDNFVKQRTDTFRLFLAIDKNMTDETAGKLNTTFNNALTELNQRNFQSKRINKQIKITYSGIHSRFLKKYNGNEYFPVTIQTGTYNCVSASMLYAMVFDHFHIPYKVMASSSHVYLVANPGENSVVIETTNPLFEKTIFTGDFKQQYVKYLRGSKLISEDDYRNKSVEELFEEKFNEVKEADFLNLPGFQYYNKALTQLENNNKEAALNLAQKAYFLYPAPQVKTLLNIALLLQIQKCNFDKVTDIDYLAQFSRFENTDKKVVIGIFTNIINHFLQYTDKESYCDSLYERLSSGISDKYLREEICFSFNMQMSYRYQNSDKIEKYVTRALSIKGNYHNARVLFENYLNRKLFRISNPYALLDSIKQVENEYHFALIKPIVSNLKSMAYLRIAKDLVEKKKPVAGEKYLTEFEKTCPIPVKNEAVEFQIANTYRSMAVYYFYKGYKSKAKTYVNRGLKYAPNNPFLKSAIY